MKEMVNERKTTVIVGYEAYDGTIFKTKEECEKYENIYERTIEGEFSKLIINKIEGYNFLYGNCSCEEDVMAIKISDEKDLNIANTYFELKYQESRPMKQEDINKIVIVSTMDGWFWRLGTKEEIEDSLKTYLTNFINNRMGDK